MAKSEMKNIGIIVMTMLIIIFGLTNANDAPLQTNSPIIEETNYCLAKCAFSCRDKLKTSFAAYVACVTICDLTCHHTLSKVAYECTTSCAYSKSNNANIGIIFTSFINYYILLSS
jgi:hypothetical protein